MKALVENLIKMLQEFLKKLPTTPEEKLAPVDARPTDVPEYITIAKGELGVKEVPGTGDNPRVLEYHLATTLKSTDDSVAWCSSFVNWCLMKSGHERSHSAAARSFLGVGAKLKGFEKHSIVVFKRGNSTWQGHVAFAMDETKTHVRVLGGNQSDAITYASYPKSDVLGYIRPKKLS